MKVTLVFLLALSLALTSASLEPRREDCDACGADVDEINAICGANVPAEEVDWLACFNYFIDAGADCVTCFCNVLSGILGSPEDELCDNAVTVPVHEVS